jgi:hypothetical protein
MAVAMIHPVEAATEALEALEAVTVPAEGPRVGSVEREETTMITTELVLGKPCDTDTRYEWVMICAIWLNCAAALLA